MKWTLFILSALLIIYPMMVSAQTFEPVNDILFEDGQEFPENEQIINTVFPLVVIYVDFLDSRLPNGQPPQDTLELQQVNINAVGSFGWIRNPSDTTQYIKKVRKYVFEDYWDLWFSADEWVGTRHPDFASHEGFVWPGYPPNNEPPWTYKLTLYGSVRDYWNEVSYGNVQILPFQTRSGSLGKYHTGIANNVDSISGQRYIRWIRLPRNKSYYASVDPNSDVRRILDSLHHLPPGNPDRIEFDITAYTGKYAIIGAGSKFGGYVTFVNSAYQVMPEKWTPHYYVSQFWDNIYEGTIFSAIGDIAHEFGHNIGFYHYQGGSYELMHWGGLQKINVNCPPHINPWQKIVKGWIPNIDTLRGNDHVQLPPIDNNPWVAVVSLFGHPGRNGVWGSNNDFGNRHSEFLIIENRQRSGFNRFSGGEFVPQGFTGGALVWHYSSMTLFPLPSGQLVYRIGMKTVNYGQPPYYQPPNPDHFFPWHGTTLGPNTNPNSNTLANLPTGISLTNIALNGGYLTFDVNFSEGAQPNYTIFFGPTDGNIPTSWSGSVYCQRNSPDESIILNSVASGTTADLYCKLQSSTLNAQGTPSQPITLRGIGNGQYRTQWYGLVLIPVGPTAYPTLEYFDVKNAIVGMHLQSHSSTTPYVRNCTFAQNQIDMRAHSANSNDRIELAGLDQNSMSTMQISGYAKLENANFTLSPVTTMHLGQLSNPADLVVIGNRALTITSPLSIDFNASIGGSTWVFQTDLTVPQGKALTLQSGSTLLFGETNSLISYGPLTAIGTSEQPITFANHASVSHWLGIHVESGLSVSELRYCQITNAITGVSVNSSRFKLKESLISDCSVGIDISGYHPKLYYQIDTNTIQNCWTTGIVINNADNVTLHDNTISGCTTGLVTTQSTSRLYRNVIENSSEEGVFAGEYSNPRFGDVHLADPGNNVIRSSGVAALHAVNSTPFLGVGCEAIYGGWNSVYGDALLVHAEKGAYVTANWNWWGADPPKEEQFLAQDAIIDYDCWMPYDPNEGMRPTGSPTLFSGNKGGDDPPPIQSITPEGLRLRQALALRAQGDYRRALVVYANLVRTNPNAPETRIALSEARNTFYDFIHASNDTTLRGVLEDSLRAYRNVHPNAFVRRLAKALLATEIANRRDFASAITEYEQLLQSATTNLDRTICLFALFNINAQNTRNRSEAERCLTQLQTLAPRDIRTRIASARFASMIEAEGGNGMQRPSVSAGLEAVASLPTEFALLQNYPNPFNPSTTIKYNLPIDAHVTLKLYDVLGREVLTLIDERAEGGYHSATLDGSRLSSGVYFYRMQAGAFSQTKKLLLLR